MMIQNIESLAGPATKYDYEASIAAGVLIVATPFAVWF